MNTELFIAKRIIFGERHANRISRPIIQIAVLGIALGIMVMILTVAIVTGFQKQIRKKVIGFDSHIQITNYDYNNSYEPKPINKNQPFYPSLEKHPGIKHIQVYATKSGIIKTKYDNEGVLLKGVGSDYDWDFIKSNMVKGDVFKVNDSVPCDSIVISKYIASKLDLKMHEKLLIFFVTKKKDASSDDISQYEQRVRAFHICGIYQTGLQEFDKKTVFVDIAQIQKLNFWNKNQIGGFEVLINNFRNIDKIGKYVYNIVGEHLNAQTTKQVNSTIFSWLDLQNVNAEIVISLMVLVAGINMISALLVLILEHTNMIGILKAIGQSNGSIQKVFLYNAMYLVGKGLFWGNLVGIALCLIQKHFGIFTLPQETYYISVVPINLNLLYVLLLNVGTLIICFLMLVVPSFIVSKITPVKAIRFS